MKKTHTLTRGMIKGTFFVFLVMTVFSNAQNQKNLPRIQTIVCCPECVSGIGDAKPVGEVPIGDVPLVGDGGKVRLRVGTEQPNPEFFSPASLDIRMPVGVPGNISVNTDGPNGGSVIRYDNGCTKETVKIPAGANPISNPTCAKDLILRESPTVVDPDAAGGTATVSSILIRRPDGAVARYDETTGNLKSYTTAQGVCVELADLPENERLNIVRQDGLIRQVRTPGGVADVVLLDGAERGYVINFYPANQAGGKNAAGIYLCSGAPARSLKVENPQWQSGRYNEVVLTETEGSLVRVNTYVYNEGNREWTRTLPDGTKVVSRTTVPVTSVPAVVAEIPPAATVSLRHFERIKERYAADGTFLGRTRQVVWVSSNDEEHVLQETKDYGGLNHTTTYAYYTAASPAKHHGQLKSILNPDGSWVYYALDAQGRIFKEYRGWLDAPMPADIPSGETGVRVTEYNYTPLVAEDVLLTYDERARTVIDRINGIETGRRYYVYKTQSGEAHEIEERAAAQNASFGAVGNMRVTKIYHSATAGVASAGKLKTVQHSDATLTSYVYELNPSLPEAYFTTTSTQGTVSTPNGIAFKSTRTVTRANNQGYVLQEESQVYTGGANYSTLNINENTRDFDGRVVQRKKDGRVVYDAEYTNGRLTRSVDETGIETVYVYDIMGQLNTSATRGITTTYARTLGGIDCGCDGSLETTVSAGNLSYVTSTQKDRLGRTLQTVDPAGLVTTYAYTNGGRTVTTLKPNTAIEVRESFVDGQSKSSTGSGVIAQYYSYGVNSNGAQWTQTNLVSANSPRWNKSTNDFFGRNVLNETPGFAGAVITSTSVYNNNGQTASQTNSVIPGSTSDAPATGTQTVVYAYDLLGNATSTTTTYAGQTTPPASNLTEHYYAQENNAWYSISRQQLQYTENSQLQTITTGLSKHQINNFSASAIAYSETHTPPFDATGVSVNKTIQTSTLNRATQTLVSTTTLPTTTQPAVQTSVNGQLTSSTSPSHGGTTLYQYDALGRQTGQKQPRHQNYSTITYNATGQLASTTDATGATTTYIYYDNGVVGAGQLRQEINALGHSTFHEYDLQGREVYTWGLATYPVVQGYNTYGQRNLLRTFRDTNADFSSPSFPLSATGDTTTWTYDDATGALLQKTYADGKGPTYTYYADGLLKTRTWARKDANNNSLTTTYAYTSQGQLSFIDYNDLTPDVSYTYNTLGQQTTITDGTGTRNFTYDPATQALTQEIYNGTLNGTLNRAYDTHTRPTGYALVDPTGTAITTAATYTYDTNGNFSQVQSDTIPSQLAASLSGTNTSSLTPNTFTYNRLANSDLISTVTGPVHTVTNTYEPNRNVLTSKQNRVTTGPNANSIISQYDYTVNALGQRITRTQTGTAFANTNTDNFTYNPRGEVVNSTNNQLFSQNRSYNYDPIGNRLNATEGDLNNQSTNPNAKIYTSNSLNQYTQITTTFPTPPTIAQPTYDDDGNLLTDGTGKVYTWDCENRLTQVTLQNSEIVKYYYDSTSRRIRREQITATQPEATIYFYNAWDVVFEKTSGFGTTEKKKTYSWGLDVSCRLQGVGSIGALLCSKEDDETSTVLSYLYDSGGNVTELVNQQGVVQTHYRYDVFGKEVVFSGGYAMQNNLRFNTKFHDQMTGLIYYGYRYYNVKDGNWASRDRIDEFGGLNLYNFCGNDPVQFIDALGNEWEDMGDKEDPTGQFDKGYRRIWKKTKETDTFQELAMKVGLHPDDASNWAVREDKPCHYSVPNTYVHFILSGGISYPRLGGGIAYPFTSTFDEKLSKIVLKEEFTKAQYHGDGAVSGGDWNGEKSKYRKGKHIWGAEVYAHGSKDGIIMSTNWDFIPGLLGGKVTTVTSAPILQKNIEQNFRFATLNLMYCYSGFTGSYRNVNYGWRAFWKEKVVSEDKLTTYQGVNVFLFDW